MYLGDNNRTPFETLARGSMRRQFHTNTLNLQDMENHAHYQKVEFSKISLENVKIMNNMSVSDFFN